MTRLSRVAVIKNEARLRSPRNPIVEPALTLSSYAFCDSKSFKTNYEVKGTPFRTLRYALKNFFEEIPVKKCDVFYLSDLKRNGHLTCDKEYRLGNHSGFSVTCLQLSYKNVHFKQNRKVFVSSPLRTSTSYTLTTSRDIKKGITLNIYNFNSSALRFPWLLASFFTLNFLKFDFNLALSSQMRATSKEPYFSLWPTKKQTYPLLLFSYFFLLVSREYTLASKFILSWTVRFTFLVIVMLYLPQILKCQLYINLLKFLGNLGHKNYFYLLVLCGYLLLIYAKESA
jgi:hypothetical protein